MIFKICKWYWLNTRCYFYLEIIFQIFTRQIFSHFLFDFQNIKSVSYKRYRWLVHVIFWGHSFYRLYPQKMFNCSEKRLNKHFNLRQIRFYRRGFLTLWLLSWNICPFALNLSNIYVNIILFQIYDFTFLLLSFTTTTLCFILRGFERNNLKKNSDEIFIFNKKIIFLIWGQVFHGQSSNPKLL